MAYGSLVLVKQKLGVTTTTFDTELTQLLADASTWVDTRLKPYVVTPITPVPAQIDLATNYLAASLYRRERIAPGLLASYEATGWKMLDDFIRFTYIARAAGVSGVSRETIASTPSSRGGSTDPYGTGTS